MTGMWKAIGDGAWVGSCVSTRFPVYTRGNAGEVYPEVFTPLSFSIANRSSERAFRRAALRTGMFRPSELDEPDDVGVGVGVFGGYAYLNLTFQRLFAIRLPGASVADVDRQWTGAGEPPPHQPQPSDRSLRSSLAALAYVWRTIRTTSLPQLERDQLRVADLVAGLPDPATASDQELRGRVDGMMPTFEELFETHLVVSGQAGLSVGILSTCCERFLGDPSLAVVLLGGLGDVDSAAPAVAMWELGRRVSDDPRLGALFDAGPHGLWDRLRAEPEASSFVAEFEAFLAEHGCRGPNEWDTAFDTWETDPDMALGLVDRMRLTDPKASPSARAVELALRRAETEAAVLASLRGPRCWLLTRSLRSARYFSAARERTKTTVVRAIHGLRLRAKELDRRLVERSGGRPGDLWYLTEDELDGYLAEPAAFAATIAERRRMHEELARRVPPFTFSGRQPPLDTWALRDAQAEPAQVGTVLTGLGGCAGRARGIARVVTDLGGAASLGPGDVLVAPHTDPSWTPLFVPAAAVVVDVGALLSHAVIVSRELGIPCAVSVTDASRRIPDGSEVEVDGTTGTVRILALP